MILSVSPTMFFGSLANMIFPVSEYPKYSGLIPMGSLAAIYSSASASYIIMANSASSIANISVPYFL